MTSNLTPNDGEMDSGLISENPVVPTSDTVLASNSTQESENEDIPKLANTEIHAEAPKKARSPRKKKVAEIETKTETVTVVATTFQDTQPEVNTISKTLSASLPEISPLEIESKAAYIETPQNEASKIVSLYKAFRPTEKLVFLIAFIIFAISIISLFSKVNDMYSVELPTHGGTYTEGIVGYARFINPLLGYTDADKDMIGLVYSGLLKATPEGRLVADLAKSWEVSNDGLTYTFTLKDDLTFQDGKPLTTDDIEFTITKAQDPLIKSPRAENWTGVTLEKVSPTEIKFTLKKPYAPFLENMTLGILPKHIWSNIETEAFDINTFNREPIGSGPFKIKKAYRNDTGIYEHYDLVPFEKYSLGKAYIERLVVKFYKNETDALDAYTNGEITALGGIAPSEAIKLKNAQY